LLLITEQQEQGDSANRACAWCSMPSSNPPSDLKTVIVCALDAAFINATDKNSNGCLNRFFGNIKGRAELWFHCIRWPNRDGNPFGKRRRSESKRRKRSPYCEDYSLNFLGVSFCSYQTRNIWCKLTGWGIGTAESANFLSIEGVI